MQFVRSFSLLPAALLGCELLACGGGLGASEGSGKTRSHSAKHVASSADGGTGEALDDSQGSSPSASKPGSPSSPNEPDQASDPNPTPEANPMAPAPTDELIPPADGEATRVARLTHSQYQNTVFELFGIADGPASGFAPDALNSFAFETSIDFRVDNRLAPEYRDAAEQLAERAVSDADVYARIVPCAGSDCEADFIAGFGRKAFRRPLTDDETQRFSALFERGAELVGSGDDFRDGVRLVIEAALQSPQFLYRTELGDVVGDDGRIELDAWEVASRLSFFLYDSMPDSELFDAAANGELGDVEQLTTQVQRMLGDERALKNLVAFHQQAWRFSRYSKISPDQDTYPGLPEDLGPRLVDASSRFVREVIGNAGGFADLMTAPVAFVDADLASLYTSDAIDSASDLVRIDLDPSERKGYLMQAGFLAANAYAIKTDPIHRGLFVVRDLLCHKVPDPPANASKTPFPADAPAPKTTREEISVLTGQDGCVSCHSTFNPAGYAFEGFDAVGRTRTQENGVDVDTSGEIQMDGASFSFANAIELVDGLATSPEANHCYASKWLEFAYGRTLFDSETTAVDALAGAKSVEALVTQLITDGGFASRAPNEVAQ